MGELWVTIAVTDRADALAPMVDDIVRQSAQAGVALTLFIAENSGSESERATNTQLFARLLAEGVDLETECKGPYRRSIAQSRIRQREWVRHRVERDGAPDVIWMLDDDNRLDHLTVDGGLVIRRLEHHVSRLMALAGQSDRPDLLIGTVTGDPPIPAAATLASRSVDVAENLRRLFSGTSSADSAPLLADLRIASEHDDYYDWSHERRLPTWQSPCRWLAQAGCDDVAATTHGLLAEARFLGSGAALTRPILTTAHQLSESWQGYRRGGNAVFFTAQACMDHRYPSLELCGMQTRRGDMIGARLLGERWSVAVSGFSVRHCRSRTVAVPTRDGLARSLMSDNLGAALTRAIVADDPTHAASQFLTARAGAIEAAMVAADSGLAQVIQVLTRCPDWVEQSLAKALRERCVQLRAVLPLQSGRLVPSVVDTMSSAMVAGRIGQEAHRLRQTAGEGT